MTTILFITIQMDILFFNKDDSRKTSDFKTVYMRYLTSHLPFSIT